MIYCQLAKSFSPLSWYFFDHAFLKTDNKLLLYDKKNRIAGLILGWFLFLFIFELLLRGLLNIIAFILSFTRNDKNVLLDDIDTGKNVTVSTVNLKQD